MSPSLTRRAFIGTAAAGLASAVTPACARFQDGAAGEQGRFRFIAVNDLHFTDQKLCAPWFEKVFAAMRERTPDAEFVLVSGDLTSECTEPEFAGLKAAFESFRIPVYVTCGNHDMTMSGDHTLYDRFFPDRYHYAFEHRGWQFFGFNTANGRGAENIAMRSSVFTWIDQNLSRFDPRKPSVIFTHFPQGYGLRRRSTNADEFLDRFKDVNVQAILNGHFHGYSETRWRDAWITTNRCCSRYRENQDDSPLKGWWVCEAHDGVLTRRFEQIPSMT